MKDSSERIVKHLEAALTAAHRAKLALQSFTPSIEQLNEADMLLFDLKQTCESLEGQLYLERKGNEEE